MANEFRFRPQHRLLQASEYTGIFGQRRVLRGALFDLHFGPGATAPGVAMPAMPRETARLGLVIPKRNAALAVTRNHCKRIAREVFRHQRAQLPALDLVLRLARPLKAAAGVGSGSTASRAALTPRLREDLDKLFKRLPR